MLKFKVILSLIIFSGAVHSFVCDNSSSANRVIYIGDSHTVGSFGQKLAKNLEIVLEKSTVKRYDVIGAALTTVIAMGTNDVHAKCKISDKAEQMASVKELLSQVRPNSKCFWVGPTEQPTDGPIGKNCGQAKIKTFIDNLKETVSQRCTYIDRREIKRNGKAIFA